MRLTQGAFSFLPDLTDEQIVKQVQYAISKGWALNVEFTDDPHPRNAYWDLWGLPLFGVKDPAAVMFEINSCRKAKPSFYVKVNAFDNSRGVESCCLSSSFKDQLRMSLVSNLHVKKRSQELSDTLFKVTQALVQKVSVTN
jgi:ribulose-bisphosphate carboxylase small chain